MESNNGNTWDIKKKSTKRTRSTERPSPNPSCTDADFELQYRALISNCPRKLVLDEPFGAPGGEGGAGAPRGVHGAPWGPRAPAFAATIVSRSVIICAVL